MHMDNQHEHTVCVQAKKIRMKNNQLRIPARWLPATPSLFSIQHAHTRRQVTHKRAMNADEDTRTHFTRIRDDERLVVVGRVASRRTRVEGAQTVKRSVQHPYDQGHVDPTRRRRRRTGRVVVV